MTINASNEGQDVLGDALKSQEAARGYNPRQWQDAANGQGKNRVLMHGSGGDAVELVEPQPAIPRMISLPDKDAEAAPIINKFFADNADLSPHTQAVIREVREIKNNVPDFDRSDTFNLAVSRVCKANNLPLEREAPMPAPLQAPTLAEEIKRLEMEAKKTRTDPGQDFSSVRRAILETTPKPKRGK